jgi:hypothetical protein
MAAIAFTAPVLPGKTEQATAFFQEVQRRVQEFAKSRGRAHDEGVRLGDANSDG